MIEESNIMPVDEIRHALGRACVILIAMAVAKIKIDGEEVPAKFLDDLMEQAGFSSWGDLHAPRDWTLVDFGPDLVDFGDSAA